MYFTTWRCRVNEMMKWLDQRFGTPYRVQSRLCHSKVLRSTSFALESNDATRSLSAVSIAEVKTCKDDFVCPRGFMNRGDKECRGKCDQRECCEKGEDFEVAISAVAIDVSFERS